MRIAHFDGPGSISVAHAPDPTVQRPTDAVVQVLLACICGSDLWPYRGGRDRTGAIGHEFVGVVTAVGSEVTTVREGDVVIAPFVWSCGRCEHCRAGWATSCRIGGGWAGPDREGLHVDGGQGEQVRVPLADGTLVRAGVESDDPRLPALLTLSDVLGTGHHAAVSGRVERGGTVAVIGDGAVGLCAVLAARRLGAERIIALSSHADRSEIARRFGATDVVAARDEEAVAAVMDLTDGLGVPSVLECVGTDASWRTSVDIARPGGTIGYVGVPAGVSQGLPARPLFSKNVTVAGGIAPVRTYIPELLPEVLSGDLDPTPVWSSEVSLDDIAEGYRRMDRRESVKVLVRP